ncbi:MAG: Lpg1974 family pore-forming outer membrane protein, partial [Thermoguttaceae bacterium]
DQNFNSAYTYAAGTGSVSLPNNMDAEGIRLGAEIQWRSCGGFRVFGRGAESVLVADFQTRQHEVDPAASINIDVSNSTAVVVPVFEAAAGVAYARGAWEFRAAYEMSDWFNMVQVNRPAQSLLLDGYFLSLSFSR